MIGFCLGRRYSTLISPRSRLSFVFEVVTAQRGEDWHVRGIETLRPVKRDSAVIGDGGLLRPARVRGAFFRFFFFLFEAFLFRRLHQKLFGHCFTSSQGSIRHLERKLT